jgi:hypothetical protein
MTQVDWLSRFPQVVSRAGKVFGDSNAAITLLRENIHGKFTRPR